jgi:hypothetical protein
MKRLKIFSICSSASGAAAAMLAVLILSPKASAANLTPIWSEQSQAAAEAKCTSSAGKVVGHPMETTTAEAGEFYIVVCQRPVDGGVTYVPAWSADNFENARERCQADSATTGLPAGDPVGTNLYVSSQNTDIFVIICSK